MSAKRIPDGDSLNDLSVGEIFRQEFGAFGGGGAGYDESIPERDRVENGAIDPILDDRRSNLNDVENAEGPKLLACLDGFDSEFARRRRVKFLEYLGRDDAGSLLGMPADEPKGDGLLGRIRAIHRVDQNVGINKTSSGHGSMAVKFFPGNLDAFGVARRLLEALDHGIDRRVRVGNSVVQKIANQCVETGSARLGVAAPPFEKFFVDGKRQVCHKHRLCVHRRLVNSGFQDSFDTHVPRIQETTGSNASPLKLPFDLRGIQWVIIGGESGPGARPMEAEWVRNIRDQCRMAEVAFFFKQWGGTRKKQTGRSLDGKTYDAYPEFAAVEALEARQRLLLLREVEAEYKIGSEP